MQHARLFGLIGRNISYSFSKKYFEEKFRNLKLENHFYELFDSDDADTVTEVLKIPNLRGVNVTIPYKETIIPLLDNLSEEARAIGAVNTILIHDNGKRTGYNTDAYGFEKTLNIHRKSWHKSALILGDGGAAKAVKYVLDQCGIAHRSVSRRSDINFDNLTPELVSEHLLVVQCTPVGTFPSVEDCLPFPFDVLTEKHLVIDLIYNPEYTSFLKNAAAKGAKTVNGYYMLEQQAEKAWEIWTLGEKNNNFNAEQKARLQTSGPEALNTTAMTPEMDNPEMNAAPQQPEENRIPATVDPTEEQTAENTAGPSEAAESEMETNQYLTMSLEELVREGENTISNDDIAGQQKKFGEIRDAFNRLVAEDQKARQEAHEAQGTTDGEFIYINPFAERFNEVNMLFKEKQTAYHRDLEQQQAVNKQQRQEIIDRLKNLYTNTEPGTNLFREIREIKEQWSKAGQVSKAEFKNLNNDYFHHLTGFYQMLDLNKEYREQEYAHNLEKRRHIIARAQELVAEPNVQKALNELQYLHKLWKEEAEPVAEDVRESTWEEFREISGQIHARKGELMEQQEKEQLENLTRKNEIIAELQQMATAGDKQNHNYWQSSIKKADALRQEFINLGSVPRKLSNQNWTEFKEALRNFNTAKNNYYKDLKNDQQQNLDRKLALIQTAKDNQDSEDWTTAVPLFKNLQEEWKKIGHVPRAQANRVWDEFRGACNHFFENYRKKNATGNDDWAMNFKKKSALLEELKQTADTDADNLMRIRNEWNATGKVPRDKMNINSEFNRLLRSKTKQHGGDFATRDNRQGENRIPDRARKLRTQVADLEAEIAKLENNLSFFSNPSRENPLLADTYRLIDDRREKLEQSKAELHQLIVDERPKSADNDAGTTDNSNNNQ